MSTSTPGGPDRETSAPPPPDDADQQGQGPAGQARSATSAPNAPSAEPGAGEGSIAGNITAVRRSLAERFAASAAAGSGAGAGGAGSAHTGTTARPGSPADRGPAERTSVVSPPEAGEAGQRPAAQPTAGPRRVRLTLSRVDPWSVMKLSFLMSVAIGIGIVVAAAVVWFVLDSMHVFADIEELLITIDSSDLVQLMTYVEFDRVISLATIVAVVDVLLLTALSTLGAFVYNLVAALVGGVHVTLTDD